MGRAGPLTVNNFMKILRVRYICFGHIFTNRDIRVIRNFTENYEDIAKYDKLWKKEKFISIVNDAGFNEAFFMPDRNNGSDNDELEIKQKGTEATRAELNRAFKKHMSSKMQNKTILNRFIAQIA